MLNEERIVLMTKLASYEQKEGKKNIAVGSFFRSDYLAIRVLKAIFCATISFLAGFAIYIIYNFEAFMQDIYKMDLIRFAQNVLIYYGILVVSYGVLAYIISFVRYARAQKKLRLYYQNLKKLNSMYKD